MADIDQIIAGGAGAGTTADFSGIPKILDYYYKSKDEAAKNDLREAFKGGVPMDANGQPDVGAMAKTFFQKGDFATGTALLGQAQDAAERAQYASGGKPPAQSAQSAQQPQPGIAPVNAPSPSRSVQGKVAPALNKGGVQDQGGMQETETPKSYLAKQGLQPGYNMEVALAYFKRNGIDPDQPFNPNDPRLAKLQPVMQRLGSIGQPQPPQPGDGQPQAQVAQAPMQQPLPPQAPATDFSDRFSASRPGNDPELNQARWNAGSKNESVAKAGRAELKTILENRAATTTMKDAAAQGLTPQQYQERQGEQAATQAGAAEMAKVRVAQYQGINENGDKAAQEIPKLQMAVKLMDSPDFQSGAGQRFDLMYRRLATRLGGDPDKAAPQEIVSKVIADSVLNGLGALKGLGPVRVAEMNLARTAAMSMDNTPQTNRFLANTAIRIQQRAVAVQEMAQNYNEGVLDNGFDKKVREMDKKNPLFSQDEVQRFQRIISGQEKQAPQQSGTSASAAPKQFQSAGDVQAAIASKQLKSGDAFLTSDGRTKYVP
jgi:hypothetical protein